MIGQITQVIARIWELFTQVQVPGLTISFAVLYLGVFAVSVSIKLLLPILGLGGNVARGPIRIGRGVLAKSVRKRKEV